MSISKERPDALPSGVVLQTQSSGYAQRARNVRGDHPFAASGAPLHRVSAHFVPPTPDMGGVIRRYGPDG